MTKRLLIAILFLLWVEPANAQEYDSQSRDWDGLSSFVKLAEGLGHTVSVAAITPWEEIGKNEVLVILYPTQAVDANHLSDFLAAGGHAIVADDFGKGNPLFARLGLLIDDAPIQSSATHAQYDFTHEAAAASKHPLTEGVGSIVSNHPSAFRSTGALTPIYQFSENQALVAAGSYGRGRLVAIADPSIFINRMLEFDSNLTFAGNLFHFLTGSKPKRIILMSGNMQFSGFPQAPTAGDSFEDFLGTINNIIETANAYVLTKPGAKALALGFAALLAAFAFSLFPSRQPVRLDGSWIRSSALVSPPPKMGKASDLHTACILRDAVSLRLARVLDVPNPFSSFDQRELAQRVQSAAGPNARRAFEQIAPQIRGLPDTAQTKLGLRKQSLSRTGLDKLARGVETLYRELDRNKNG